MRLDVTEPRDGSHPNSVMAHEVLLFGRIAPGKGISSGVIEHYSRELRRKTGEDLYFGSLNVLLDKPVLLRVDKSIVFGVEHANIWRGRICGYPVWIYRWRGAPLHVVEILSPLHLRTSLRLSDDDRVTLAINMVDMEPVSFLKRAVWTCFFYSNDAFYERDRRFFVHARFWCSLLGACQSPNVRTAWRDWKQMMYWDLRSVLARLPGARRVVRKIRQSRRWGSEE